jgi:hypothetical protein
MRNDYGLRSEVRFSKGGKASKKKSSSKKGMASVKKLDNMKMNKKK